MSSNLRFLCYERDRDGHKVAVYEDAYGRVQRILELPKPEYVEWQTKCLAAETKLIKQRVEYELAKAELDDVRQVIANHHRALPPSKQKARTLPPRVLDDVEYWSDDERF